MSSRDLLPNSIRRWLRDEDGSVAVEAMLFLPLLFWVYMATFSFFHGYKVEATSFKANITIADMFSREADYVSPSFIDGAKSLLDFLASSDDDPELRVTAFRWDEDDGEYQVSWSQNRGDRPPLTTADLLNELDRLPIMYDNEMAILVETWIDYEPVFDVGVDARTMDAFTVISPRFVQQLCYNTSSDPNTALC